MILFAGNPTNVICEGFGVNNVAYNAYAIFPLISVARSESRSFSNFVQKNVPKRLDTTEGLPLFSAIPSVPAWGAMLLGSCLVAIIAMRFFGIDVWKINRPLAVAKFFFDTGWDCVTKMVD